MSDDIKLGELLDYSVKKDATHVALWPMIAKNELFPGQRIGINEAIDLAVAESQADSVIGIVDPFLNHSVPIGKRFYCWLFPNTVTGMRHDWEHPVLNYKKESKSNNGSIQHSIDWITSLAQSHYMTYDSMMKTAEYAISRSNDLCFNSEVYDISDDERDLFWTHYSIITGTSIDARTRNASWHCAC